MSTIEKRGPGHSAFRTAVSAVAVVAAFLLRQLLVLRFGLDLPIFILFYPTIMLVGLYGGFWQGLLATVLSAVLADYWILPPVGAFTIARTSDFISLVTFIGFGVLLSVVADRYRRNLLRVAAFERERVLQEMIAQEQAAKYARSLIEASLDPLVTISPEGKITDVNEAAIRITGVQRDKLVGTDFADYFTEPEKAREGYQLVFSEGLVRDYPLTIRHAEGHLKEVLYNASVYKDVRGKVLGVFAAARDVTVLKQIEASLKANAVELARSNADLQQFAYVASHDLQEALRESELRYRNLFDSMDEGFCVIEVIFDAASKPVDYRFLMVNRTFEGQTGLHQAQGKLMRELAPEHEEHWFEIYGRIALTGEPAHFQNEAKALNRFYSVHAYRVGEAELRRVAIVFEDIGESKRAEEALRESEEKLALFVSHAPAALAMFDGEMRYLYASSRWRSDFGFGDRDLKGRSHYDVFPEISEEWKEAHRRGLRGEVLRKDADRFERADGSVQWIRWEIRPWHNAEGHVGGILIYTEDITAIKQVEQERQTATDFLTMINRSRGIRELLENASSFFQEQSGCEAVGVRLREGDDYPYYESRGFSPEFVVAEGMLCAREASGKKLMDSAGAPIIECMCGNIIRGRFEPSQEFFTPSGSFWTNSTTELIGSATEADLLTKPRNRCNREGYESVALFPLIVGNERIGLLQLNDRRKGQFSPQMIALWERLAGYLATAVAKFRTEDALQESEKRLRLALDAGSMGMWDMDIESGRVSWNEEMFMLLGYEPGSTIPSHEAWLQRVLAEDRSKAQGAFSGSLEYGVDLRTEYRVQSGENEVTWIEARGRSERDKNGKAIRSFGVAIDITERKAIEEALRAQADLLDLAHDGIMVCGMDGTIRFWNHGAELMYGYSKQQAIGKIARILLNTEFPQPLAEIETLARQAGRWEGELIHTTREGKRIVDASRWVLQRDKDGQARGLMVINRDITERKRAAEVKQAEEIHRLLLERTLMVEDRERRQLARELHDETGQMLTALLVGLRTMEDARNLEDVKAQGQWLREITAQAIEEVGLISRGLHPSLLDDHGLGAALSRYVADYSKIHKIDVHLLLDEEVSRNLPSRLQLALYRILQEVLTNVARHSGAKAVNIKFTPSTTAVEVAITDDGCGFDAEAVAVSSHRLGIQGMRERAAMLGGTIKFIPQPKGTRILVQIPLGNPDVQASAVTGRI